VTPGRWAPRRSVGQYLLVAVTPKSENPVPSSWSDPDQVDWYLTRIGGLPPRAAGEEVLVSVLPDSPCSVLDLGCGDGRLAALILEHRHSVQRVVALDSSPAMLGRAEDRFRGDERVSVREWNLEDPLTSLGSFDVVVAGFSIHHLEDERKRASFGEIAQQLTIHGLFVNLEVVASATPELHRQFLDLIGRSHDDPEDRLSPIEDQLLWMREAGLTQVDCLWRWRGFALLAGQSG
jgi:tRNA (cmo5U34)-methyltransferase